MGGQGDPPTPVLLPREGWEPADPGVTAGKAVEPSEVAALIQGARADEQNSSCSLPCFPTGGLGAGVKVHFLAWLEFSLVYFLPFEFSKTEVRVRVSSGVMSMSLVADSLRPCPKTSFYSG